MAFVWDASFETGVEEVDQQHRGLINLINEFNQALVSDEGLGDELRGRLVDRLFAYAGMHFKMEEDLMLERRVDLRHIAFHLAEHAHFADRMVEFKTLSGLGGDLVLDQGLVGFLVHWLSVHILDVDQRMARQIELIKSGVAPGVAYEKTSVLRISDESRQVMVSVLVDFYALLGERKKIVEAASRYTDRDSLTGLPHRQPFIQALNEAAVRTQAEAQVLGLLLIDVDGLSEINRHLGHDRGDRLLVSLAERLRRSARGRDLLARTGDDEFALALVAADDAQSLTDAATRLFDVLNEPVFFEGEALEFSISGGLALLPADAADAEHLLTAAEMAQNAAKQDAGSVIRRFDGSMGRPGFVRAESVRELRDAIQNNQLILHYQPQVNLRTGEIVGVEALVRWMHPTRGMVPPGLFIPLAEESGLVIPLGVWVIREAMAQSRRWREAAAPEVRVAVNLSARHFRQPGLPELIDSQLHEFGIEPHHFELELTESVMMQDPQGAIRVIDQLKDLGIKLSLDDFGTGYSSLAYLSRFSIDTLKIDQSFVRDITSNPINASIATATIAMAHKLGKNVIAEGVETEAQLAYLRNNDCDEMQGYFFSRPVPAPEAEALLRQGAAWFGAVSQGEVLPSLLLVDDEANVLSALRRLLRREGYAVLTASSGAEALELLALHPVQVILSDQRMPEMTGSELLSRVKQLYPDTVRMVLSGYSDLSAVTDAINRGAIYKFLSKPWHDEDLKDEVRRAFRHYGELKARG